MRALVIVNPHAHSGYAQHHDPATRDRITAQLKTLPMVDTIDWIDTRHPSHGVELARQASEDGCAYIVAVGGDGTINEVLNGIMTAKAAQRPVLGVLPWGTLNDFYDGVRAAEAHLSAAANGLPVQPLDVGHVLFDELERYCCLSISVGLSSWANMKYQQISQLLGRRFAHLPSAVDTLLTYRFNFKAQITLDDQPAYTTRALALAISNCPGVGGGVRLTPNARIDDGYFDLATIAPVPLWRLAIVLLQARLGHPDRKVLQQARFRTILISSNEPFSVHLDGELIPKVLSETRTIRLNVLPAALQILRPSFLADR